MSFVVCLNLEQNKVYTLQLINMHSLMSKHSFFSLYPQIKMQNLFLFM